MADVSVGTWANRIVGEGFEAPDQLLANPMNWRVHPDFQQQATRESLEAVGWLRPVLVNRTTDHIVDGHLRVMLALKTEQPTVPVSYVELTEEEERLALATLDPLADLAIMDEFVFTQLRNDLPIDLAMIAPNLDQMLANLAGSLNDDALVEGSTFPSVASVFEITAIAESPEDRDRLVGALKDIGVEPTVRLARAAT